MLMCSGECVYVLRIASVDNILCFVNTLIIIMCSFILLLVVYLCIYRYIIINGRCSFMLLVVCADICCYILQYFDK